MFLKPCPARWLARVDAGAQNMKGPGRPRVTPCIASEADARAFGAVLRRAEETMPDVGLAEVLAADPFCVHQGLHFSALSKARSGTARRMTEQDECGM